jgi:hypothetical protein
MEKIRYEPAAIPVDFSGMTAGQTILYKCHVQRLAPAGNVVWRQRGFGRQYLVFRCFLLIYIG